MPVPSLGLVESFALGLPHAGFGVREFHVPGWGVPSVLIYRCMCFICFPDDFYFVLLTFGSSSMGPVSDL